jgi:hypothetical protein
MLKTRIACAALILLNLAAASKKPTKWKYAGEDHGIRFFFKAKNECKDGPIVLKVENTLSLPVEVSFRVMDIDWNKEFASALAPNQIDSSTVFHPKEGSSVCHPFFDRIYLEQSQGMEDRTLSMSGE